MQIISMQQHIVFWECFSCKLHYLFALCWSNFSYKIPFSHCDSCSCHIRVPDSLFLGAGEGHGRHVQMLNRSRERAAFSGSCEQQSSMSNRNRDSTLWHSPLYSEYTCTREREREGSWSALKGQVFCNDAQETLIVVWIGVTGVPL